MDASATDALFDGSEGDIDGGKLVVIDGDVTRPVDDDASGTTLLENPGTSVPGAFVDVPAPDCGFGYFHLTVLLGFAVLVIGGLPFACTARSLLTTRSQTSCNTSFLTVMVDYS